MQDYLRKKIAKATASDIPEPGLMSIDVNKLSAYAGQQHNSPWEYSIYDGEKFFGGFGTTQVQQIDYWTLRARSAELFNNNLYARGVIRRLVTNEINTGLTPESVPDENILGFEDGALNEWTETTENRFGLWGKNPKVCDFKQRNTFGAQQSIARMEALVSGDVLVVLRQSPATKLPTVQLVSGNRVRTPLLEHSKNIPNNHKIIHGVQYDGNNRIVGYWVLQDDGTTRRMPAYGEKSGRRIAWLVFGTDKRLDDVRGQPLLSLVLQSLKDIDRYRDSTQRKALINSFFAASVEKNDDKPGTLPVPGAAVRNDATTVANADGTTRQFNISTHIPGIVLDELQTGEKLNMHTGQGTDLNFGDFEETITAAIAWANEVPPEILRLTFSNNYSASQAAINEFKIYLNKIWSNWGETFCTPVYIEWLISESLLGKNTKAAGLLQSWRDNSRYDIFGAWTAVEWYGSIKPSTDMVKQTKGSEALVKNGWSTNAREARVTTGTKFSKNVKRLQRENEQLAKAWKPILELKAEYGEDAVNNVLGQDTANNSGGEATDDAKEG